MAIVETLEVRFQAQMGDLAAQLNGLSDRFLNLSAALDAGQSKLSGGAAGMIRTVGEALTGGASASAAPGEAGKILSDGFAAAILSGQANAANAARQLSRSASFADAAAVTAAVGAGKNLGAGFARGIASTRSTVLAAADRIASAAVARIRSALRIHSPSKIAWEMGVYFGEGFAEGIAASVHMAETGAGALGASAVHALGAAPVHVPADTGSGGLSLQMKEAVQEALGNTSIVIPMYVDGMKLGEASIRGINRVTRSTGRLMLEI